MTALTLTLTNAGRGALVNAGAGGTAAVVVTQAGLTASAFVAAPTLTALPGEFKRVGAIAGQAVDPTTVHLTVRDEGTDAYTVRGVALYLANGTLFATYSQALPILEKSSVSTFLLAADLRFVDGTAQLVQFGNTNFVNPPASENVQGVACLATVTEALAGAVANKLITPVTMHAVLGNYLASDRVGVPSGIATLGPDGKLLLAQRPPVDLIDVFAVASQAAMLALVATPGDFAVRSDNGRVYVLQVTPATTLGNWLEISTPAPVSSVNGKVGTVVLVPSDIGAVPTSRTVTGTGLATGGGNLGGNISINVPIATQEECFAAIRGDLAVTPSGLGPIVVNLAYKVPMNRSVYGTGLARGGGQLTGDRAIEVAIASAADIIAGAANDKAITPAALASLPRSLTPNGFYQLPGGLIIQWVQNRNIWTTETWTSINWPIVFPNAPLVGSVTGWLAAPSNYRDLWPQLVAPDQYGCGIQLQRDDPNDLRIDGFDIIMLGY